jgi:DNA helicase-2/ATP-dependent DNA helicase PcrA
MKLAKNAVLTVIGDPHQSVYGFRGAYGSIFNRLARDRGDLTRMDLTFNFRSNPAICQASEAIRPEGGSKRIPVRKVIFKRIIRGTFINPTEEANWALKKIESFLGVTGRGRPATSSGDSARIENLSLADIAIIFRLRQVGQEMVSVIEKSGFPFQVAGEEEEKAIDGLDFKADKISLLTMHASKGLEFRVVFVIGLEEGVCPYEPPEPKKTSGLPPLHGQPNNPFDLNEERRLFYVAITRAKDVLCVSRSTSRFLFGRKLSGNPSPYWEMLPPSHCHDTGVKDGTNFKKYRPYRIVKGPRLF